MATVVNRASDETLVKEAYAHVKGDWAALAPDQLLQVNLDVQLAAQTVLGAWPEIKAFRESLAKLPDFNIKPFDNLEGYALAMLYVQSRYVMATQPPNDLQDLFAEATKLRDVLLTDARALSMRGLFDERKLDGLRGGTGYKNVAQDLQALAVELEAILPKIQGKSATTVEDIQAATQMATRLTRVVGEREQAPAVVAELADERARAFTQLLRTYEDARAAITYLRRSSADADGIAPNLYTGNVRQRKGSQPANPVDDALITPIPGTVPAVSLPANGAHPPGAGGAAPPPAAKGSEPFLT